MVAHVVTCFLRNRGEVLLARRSDDVGTYRGRWGGVSGYAEGDPDDAARTEIDEETGLLDAASIVRSGDPLTVEDRDAEWVVHPYLFDCSSRELAPSREIETAEWVSPTEILRQETVPGLWAAYERVAPTVSTVREDTTHGSASISIRALEVLRDRAGALAAHGGDGWDELTALAAELLDARPSMAVLETRVNRAMYEARERSHAAAAEEATRAGIERAYEVDTAAAETAAGVIGGETVVTLSRSGTVTEALCEGDPASIVVLESRPDREGAGVAERLADGGRDVTITIDAAVAHVLDGEPDRVLVGADTVLADGGVVNKAGTRTAAIAAARENVPVSVVAATDKISPDADPDLESGDPTAVYGGDAALAVEYPVFDHTPASLVTGVITEDGVLDDEGVAERARTHRRWAEWRAP